MNYPSDNIVKQSKTPTHIYGLKIVLSKEMVDITKERIQCKKHKKRRINKKWAKRYGTMFPYRTEMFNFEDKLIMHPCLFDKIKHQLN